MHFIYKWRKKCRLLACRLGVRDGVKEKPVDSAGVEVEHCLHLGKRVYFSRYPFYPEPVLANARTSV